MKAGAYERAVREKKTHNFGLALPPEFKGKLPTARQLADVAREFLPAPSARPRRKTKKS
jgi:hypothetical protein